MSPVAESALGKWDMFGIEELLSVTRRVYFSASLLPVLLFSYEGYVTTFSSTIALCLTVSALESATIIMSQYKPFFHNIVSDVTYQPGENC